MSDHNNSPPTRRDFLSRVMVLFSLPILGKEVSVEEVCSEVLPPNDWIGRILASPDDEMLRLGYADWLAEQGNPLGKYIRLECELEHASRATAEYYRLEALRARLAYEGSDWKQSHSVRWSDQHFSQVQSAAPTNTFHARMRRGMLEELIVDDVPSFLSRYTDILSQAPLIRSLKVIKTADSQALQQLFRCPLLENVRELELSRCLLDNVVLSACAASDYLRQLRALVIDECKVDANALAELLERGPLASLQSFALCWIEFLDGMDHRRDARLLCALSHAPACRNLVEIDYRRCAFLGPMAVSELTHGPLPKQLQMISLDGGNVASEDLEALLSHEHPHLRKLSIRRGSHGHMRLDLEKFPTLEELVLSDIDLDDQVIHDVGRTAPHTLVDLSIRGGTVSGLAPLVASQRLPNLRFLDLGDNHIRSHAVATLADSTILNQLVALRLGWNFIDALGARRIAESVNARNLRFLHLGDNQIGDEGAFALAASSNLRNLNWLNLDSNGLSESGVLSVLNSPNFENLNAMRADDYHVNGATAGRFAERFGVYDFMTSYAFYGRLI